MNAAKKLDAGFAYCVRERIASARRDHAKVWRLALGATGRTVTFSAAHRWTMGTFGTWYGRVILEARDSRGWKTIHILTSIGDRNFDVMDNNEGESRLYRIRFLRSRRRFILGMRVEASLSATVLFVAKPA